MAGSAQLALGAAAAVAAAVLAASGCAARAVPDPHEAVAGYERAVSRGDAHAVYGLLTKESRAAHGEEETRRLLEEAKQEISAQARAIAAPGASARATAEVPFVDGERAVLVLENGEFRVDSAAGLPALPRTPGAALAELRAALARRSYSALVRVLSRDTRAAIERDLGALVEGLAHPDSLLVKVHGEAAEVQVPGGHRVLLEREGGVWRIRDFD